MLHNQSSQEWTWPGCIKSLRSTSVSMNFSVFIQYVILTFSTDQASWFISDPIPSYFRCLRGKDKIKLGYLYNEGCIISLRAKLMDIFNKQSHICETSFFLSSSSSLCHVRLFCWPFFTTHPNTFYPCLFSWAIVSITTISKTTH